MYPFHLFMIAMALDWVSNLVFLKSILFDLCLLLRLTYLQQVDFDGVAKECNIVSKGAA